mgnify:CR=1 FL=1
MAILLATLLTFVGLMLTFQLIYFEISRKRALRVNNLVWFEQFNRPFNYTGTCLLYTSPSPRDRTRSRMPSSA